MADRFLRLRDIGGLLVAHFISLASRFCLLRDLRVYFSGKLLILRLGCALYPIT